MSAGYRQKLGRSGESFAADFLVMRGYSIIGKNYRTPYGEIDLVARMNETIVFVEVKTRASKTLGPPEISVTARKQEHMRSAAEYYIQQHPEQHEDYRIDLITVQKQADNLPPLVDHFENVIS